MPRFDLKYLFGLGEDLDVEGDAHDVSFEEIFGHAGLEATGSDVTHDEASSAGDGEGLLSRADVRVEGGGVDVVLEDGLRALGGPGVEDGVLGSFHVAVAEDVDVGGGEGRREGGWSRREGRCTSGTHGQITEQGSIPRTQVIGTRHPTNARHGTDTRHARRIPRSRRRTRRNLRQILHRLDFHLVRSHRLITAAQFDISPSQILRILQIVVREGVLPPATVLGAGLRPRLSDAIRLGRFGIEPLPVIFAQGGEFPGGEVARVHLGGHPLRLKLGHGLVAGPSFRLHDGGERRLQGVQFVRGGSERGLLEEPRELVPRRERPLVIGQIIRRVHLDKVPGGSDGRRHGQGDLAEILADDELVSRRGGLAAEIGDEAARLARGPLPVVAVEGPSQRVVVAEALGFEVARGGPRGEDAHGARAVGGVVGWEGHGGQENGRVGGGGVDAFGTDVDGGARNGDGVGGGVGAGEFGGLGVEVHGGGGGQERVVEKEDDREKEGPGGGPGWDGGGNRGIHFDWIELT
mmetsp:Transcript_18876/g.39577  ORF Transcript_18876/g.39577 Transcript_18876/m.39577 type:complete len:520 (-) Transcript_18876:26-1585(-)